MNLKPTVIISLLVAGSLMLASCNGSVPTKAQLETDTDSLSYLLGLMQSIEADQMDNYLEQSGIGKDGKAKFLEGVWAGIDKGYKATVKNATEPDDIAFNNGVSVGEQIQQRSLSRTEKMLEFDESQNLSKKNFMAGFADMCNGTIVLQRHGKPIDREGIAELADSLVQAIAVKTFTQKYAAEKKQSEDFIAQKAKGDSIHALADGICYKEIKAGTGEKPGPDATVRVAYEGRFMDGKVFDATVLHNRDFDEFSLQRVIPGWRTAIAQMPVGAVWEVYLPWEQAYGALGNQPDIPPFAALVFHIELKEISK